MTTDPNPDRPEVDDPRVLALAKARQQMAHSNPFNVVCPPWDGLTGQEQQLSLLDARNYLRAAIDAGLTATAPVAVPPADRAGLREWIAEALLDHLSRTADIRPGRGGDLAFMPEVTDEERMRITDVVLAVLPPAADRPIVLREEAARIRAHCPDRLDDDSAEGAWLACHCAVADDMERRLAAEATPVAAPTATPNGTGAAVAASGDDLIEDYLRFLRGQGPEPDLAGLTPDDREAFAGQFEIVKALFDRGPELPPIDRDPVARRLGLHVPAAETPGPETQGAHSCGNCEGIDPDSCLTNLDRSAARQAATKTPDEAPGRWCKCRSCWGWFVEDHPGEDLDELGRDLGWWSGLPEHRDAPAVVAEPGKEG